MQIGIISDSHDNFWRMGEALPYLRQCKAVLHCGDLISPFMVKQLVEGLGEIPVHLVWGNNDGDHQMVSKIAAKSSSFHLHGELAELDIEGVRIAINHYPEIGVRLAQSQAYDLVCFGHNHTASLEQVKKTVLLNPGEVLGLNGRSTMVLFDLFKKTSEFVELHRSQSD
jgi:putative phosphoesterase